MEAQIGETAGCIWQYLAQHGTATLPQLQRGTALPERLVQMGVGWLALKGKLRFVQERGVLKLSLHLPSSADRKIKSPFAAAGTGAPTPPARHHGPLEAVGED